MIFVKKTRNTAVGLWSFIFVVAIGLTYVNNYFWLDRGVKIIFNGGYILAFFMFLAGFYLMSHYKNSGIKSKDEPASKAWNYFFKNVKSYYPILFGGVLISFLVRNFINGTRLSSYFALFMDSLWEFLGLSSIGAVGICEVTSIHLDNVLGFSHLWNYPLVYASAFLVISLILYYILAKSEDFFKGLFAPLVVFSILYILGLHVNNLEFINIVLLKVMAGMIMGMLSYYVVNYLKKKKFSEFMMMVFSLLHVGFSVFFLYTIYAGFSWSVVTHSLFLYGFFIVLMTNKDYISALYNDSNFCEFLGNISIYYYAFMIVFVFLLAYLFPQLNYVFSILFNVLFTLGFSGVVYGIDKYWKNK